MFMIFYVSSKQLIKLNFMITINYQTYGQSGFHLRLRLYQNGEIKYITISKFLKGDLKKHHWNPKKQRFIPSAPFSEENNDFLMNFRQKYEKVAFDWEGSLDGLLLAVKSPKVRNIPTLGS
jgi:hypothetical protein